MWIIINLELNAEMKVELSMQTPRSVWKNDFHWLILGLYTSTAQARSESAGRIQHRMNTFTAPSGELEPHFPGEQLTNLICT